MTSNPATSHQPLIFSGFWDEQKFDLMRFERKRAPLDLWLHSCSIFVRPRTAILKCPRAVFAVSLKVILVASVFAVSHPRTEEVIGYFRKLP